MNVFDIAHQLAKSLKESNEYKTFKELEKKMKSNPSIKSMMEDFRKSQFEVQNVQMRGQQVDEDKLNKLQELSTLIMKEPTISEYVKAEVRFTQMLTDIYKILGESVEFNINLDDEVESL